MEFSNAISLLKGRLSNYQSTVIDQVCKDEMNQVQINLEQGDFQPWFLLTEGAEADNLVDDERLPVPADFIMEWEEGGLRYKATTATVWTELQKEDYDYLRVKYPTADIPRGYAEAGLNFIIVPTPTVVYNWRMRYYAHQPANVGDTDENAWLKYASDWLINETGMIIANNYLGNKTATEGFVAMARSAKARLEKLTVAKLEANRERMMGE